MEKYAIMAEHSRILTEVGRGIVEGVMRAHGIEFHRECIHQGVPCGRTEASVRLTSGRIDLSKTVESIVDGWMSEAEKVAEAIKAEVSNFRNPRITVIVSNIPDSGENVYGDQPRILWEVANQPVDQQVT